MENIRFVKMHGLGNDFVIIDSREKSISLQPELIKELAHRNCGVGFDQLAIIFKSNDKKVDEYLKFWNSDGSPSLTCGNATRCIAQLLMDEKRVKSLKLLTDHTILHCKRDKDGEIFVNMGKPNFGWSDIPLAYKCNTLKLPLEGEPVATNLGNPHCTFFVKNLNNFDIVEFGKKYEKHPLFPKKTNVQLAEIIDAGRIKVKVWERGVGYTMSSGSSSCAVAVAAARKGLSGQNNKILLDGGELDINWGNDGVWMSGKTAHIYDGEISSKFLSNWKDYYDG